MLGSRTGFATAVLLSSALCSVPAEAEPMDPTVHRFGISSPTDFTPCSFDGTTITAPGGQCYADNDSYQRLLVQFGNAVSLSGLSPARTTGYRHFYVGLETSISNLGGVDGSAPPTSGMRDTPGQTTVSDEWQRYQAGNFLRIGTEGNPLSPTDTPAQQARYYEGNNLADGRLTWMRLAFRKGLPLGLEIGGSAGRVLQTSLWTFSFEMKWALLEGYRRRWPAAFPDFALRAGVTSIAGVHGFTLTVPTFGFTISKPIVLGDTITLTPYITAQAVWIFADSEVVDVTPGSDLDNEGDKSLITFDRIREWHPRLAGGLQVRYTRFLFNALFRMDVSDQLRGLNQLTSGDNQWSVDIATGVLY